MEIMCKVCGSNKIRNFLDIPNHYQTKKFLSSYEDKGYVWNFIIDYCEECGFLQIREPIKEEFLYENYLTPSSWKFQPHMEHEIELIKKIIVKKGKVLEIGCNDGLFLRKLKDHVQFQTYVGIEPCKDVYKMACKENYNECIELLNLFFTSEISKILKEQYGMFDMIYARQVFEHINDVNSFLGSTHDLMSDDSILMLEVPDCLPQIKNGDISFIWEEHVNYFTENTLQLILIKNGFDIICLQRYIFSGNAITVFCKKASKLSNKSDYHSLEEKNHIRNFWQKFIERINDIIEILNKEKALNNRNIVYGGGAWCNRLY